MSCYCRLDLNSACRQLSEFTVGIKRPGLMLLTKACSSVKEECSPDFPGFKHVLWQHPVTLSFFHEGYAKAPGARPVQPHPSASQKAQLGNQSLSFFLSFGRAMEAGLLLPPGSNAQPVLGCGGKTLFCKLEPSLSHAQEVLSHVMLVL